jgi:hypothetical protein
LRILLAYLLAPCLLQRFLRPSNPNPVVVFDCAQVEFDRVAEAQRAGIHSTLLLTMYDLTGSSSSHCAVFELAQHEVDQDFTHAVNILNSVCQVSSSQLPCS